MRIGCQWRIQRGAERERVREREREREREKERKKERLTNPYILPRYFVSVNEIH